jgi:hypothetical protein
MTQACGAPHVAIVADDDRAAEHGVLSRALAAARPETRRRLRSGTWKAYGSVVVTHNGPLDEAQRAWVAVLRAGPGAVLAAAWAVREHGVDLEVPARPQVVVPAHRSWPRIPDVDIRRSRLLGPEHVHPVRQPPVFRLARATLDATSLCRDPTTCARCCAHRSSSDGCAPLSCAAASHGWVR